LDILVIRRFEQMLFNLGLNLGWMALHFRLFSRGQTPTQMRASGKKKAESENEKSGGRRAEAADLEMTIDPKTIGPPMTMGHREMK
jgi:hypothetical protein